MRTLLCSFVIAVLGVVSNTALADPTKDVNVVNTPTVNVGNLPATQPISGSVSVSNNPEAPLAVEIENGAANPIPVSIQAGSPTPGVRNLITLFGRCTVPSGGKTCAVLDIPPAPPGTIYVLRYVSTSNMGYETAANVLFSLQSRNLDGSGSPYLVFRSMKPFAIFGTEKSFNLDIDLHFHATAVNSINVLFPDVVEFDRRVPFEIQAEVVPTP